MASNSFMDVDTIWETAFEPHSLSLERGKFWSSPHPAAQTRDALDGNHNHGFQNGILFAADWSSGKVWHRDNQEWYEVCDLSGRVAAPGGLLVNLESQSIGGSGGFQGGDTGLRDLLVTDASTGEVIVFALRSLGFGGRWELATDVPELRFELEPAAQSSAIAYADPGSGFDAREIFYVRQNQASGAVLRHTLGTGTTFSRTLDAFEDPDGSGAGLPEIATLTDVHPAQGGGSWHYLSLLDDRDKKTVRMRFSSGVEEVLQRQFLLPFVPLRRVREAPDGSILKGHGFCLPALDTPMPYGSVFVSCVTRDGESNNARMEFEFKMVETDEDLDALGATVDPPPHSAGSSFSDEAAGGVTTGEIVELGGFESGDTDLWNQTASH